jgi:vancomycin permeability regulator SanA
MTRSLKQHRDDIESYLKTFHKCLWGRLKHSISVKNNEKLSESIVSFYFGGKERVKYLRAFFRYLIDQGVAIYVVTNNIGCEQFHGLLRDILRRVFQTNKFKILCGMHHKGDKALAIAHEPTLKKICTYKLKKSKTKKSKTKRN